VLPQRVDRLIVFGNGPVKPVLLWEEATLDQQTQWETFQRDPLYADEEPDFRILDIDAEKLMRRTSKTRQQQRDCWQTSGHYVGNRWLRQGALAAGQLLLQGTANRIIFSGGRTMPKWYSGPTEDQGIKWPSEAELMQDIVVRRYGRCFLDDWGCDIRDFVDVEDESTNTLENLAYSVNKSPGLADGTLTVGLLAAEFHIRRVTTLAQLFSLNVGWGCQFSSSQILGARAELRSRWKYVKMERYMCDQLRNNDLRSRWLTELQLEYGLAAESWLKYWLGYLGDVKNPLIVQRVINALAHPRWHREATALLVKVGVNVDGYSGADLVDMQANRSHAYDALIGGLKRLKTSEFREVPKAFPR
jgi:uncharacterized SAM-binding protein YcdF (DUF218 family)